MWIDVEAPNEIAPGKRAVAVLDEASGVGVRASTRRVDRGRRLEAWRRAERVTRCSDWAGKNLAAGGIQLVQAPTSGLGHSARQAPPFLPSFEQGDRRFPGPPGLPHCRSQGIHGAFLGRIADALSHTGDSGLSDFPPFSDVLGRPFQFPRRPIPSILAPPPSPTLFGPRVGNSIQVLPRRLPGSTDIGRYATCITYSGNTL